ncbi:hypothetical protein Joe_78 [Streptomyces phage Joe]|uniref:Uncharacterized protein n=1 Tax=Streptomyces phage Joe TaxID=1913034 RepID=A0A1J0GP19_9CAUD|nr:hypothetical protein KGG94_gp78 [Streptomyces phage Joe]APC43318.1 hypothetical protein Joe_78 [Streptomyces phage Joe]
MISSDLSLRTARSQWVGGDSNPAVCLSPYAHTVTQSSA